MKVKDLWIDLDGTVMDFAKGDLKKSLESMRDPKFYKNVKPFESAIDILGDASNQYSINIISGIPDLKNHGKYLGDISPLEYRQYYQEVSEIKKEVLDKYFGKGFFDIIEFTKASESKGSIVSARWYNDDKSAFGHTMLFDDYNGYCIDWRKYNGQATQIKENTTLSVAIRDLMSREANY